MTEAPTRRLRSSINCRICAWIVTSSAVVGSSAIRSLGLQASEIAIMTRWLRDTNQCQHLDGACLCGLLVQSLMNPQRLTDLTADGQHRIEARHRLLEDHRNVVAAD